MKVLTIAIPTYNREKELDICLDSFLQHSVGIRKMINFVISDNNSNYDVEKIINKYKKLLTIIYVKNSFNVGMTQNFINCLKLSPGEYVWLFSDDEYITNDSLRKILFCIQKNKPSYIFLNNSRRKKNKNNRKIECWELDRDKMIRKVGINSTLITSNIFRKECLAKLLNHKYTTYFPHYSIYFEIIKNCKKFLIVDGDLFIATPNNSGGYKWFEIFIDDLNGVIEKYSELISKGNRRIIENQLLVKMYFKQFLKVGALDKKIERFEYEDYDLVYRKLKTRFKHRLYFWMFIFTTYKMNKKLKIKVYELIVNKFMPKYRKKY